MKTNRQVGTPMNTNVSLQNVYIFKAAKFGSLKMHVLCKVGKNIIFQNKTFLVMFFWQNKTFWYQFCNFKHFLKVENSEDSLASSWHSKLMVSSVTLFELSDCWHYSSIRSALACLAAGHAGRWSSNTSQILKLVRYCMLHITLW